MPVYYRGPEVVITGEVFAVLAPDHREFRLAELHDPHIVRGDRHLARVVGAPAAGGAVVLTAGLWPIVDTRTAVMLAIALVATPSLVGGACWRMTRPVYELRAVYRGSEIRLYRSSDCRVFGQVKRGLVRALEDTAARSR